MSVPNLITLGRLLSVPVTVWLIISGQFTAAFWVFLLAGASDALDGFLAKRFNQISDLGRYLDPLADKTLLVSIYVALGSQGFLPPWLVILVVSRDVLIVGGILFSYTLSLSAPVHPIIVSKVNTAVQIALAATVLATLGLGLQLDRLVLALVYVVAASTITSGASYLVRWSRVASRAGGT